MVIKLENLPLTVESIKDVQKGIQNFYKRLDNEIVDAVLSNIIDRYCNAEHFDPEINEF